jgi:Peptidase family M1 domain
MRRSGLVLVAACLTILVSAETDIGAQRRSGRRQPAAKAPAPSTPLTTTPPPAPTEQRSPRNASYSIDADLDPASRTLTGREVLTWRNITSQPTNELRFHLYWNAWQNRRSSWMRERVRGLEAAREPTKELLERPASDWSSVEINALQLLAAGSAQMTDLMAGARYIAPDDGNADDRTVLSVPLPAAVAPGETATVEVRWTAHVPRTFARTGAVGNFFFIAQWFPKIGVLEENGWNAHQFHASTEFFSDYGVYDVRITVPRGWVVGATGRERSRTDTPAGKTVHQYVEADVHDFAWTTSPDYIVQTARFEHPRLPAVEMRLLLQPEHASQAERHFDATRAALRAYGEWYGPYPYGHVTIVDPAWQSAAGGMEYPTLFTAGSHWLAPPSTLTPEGVTIHECGHQFWYGIVGNNEFEHAWLDEGLNTFSTGRVVEESYSPNFSSIRLFGGFVPWVFYDMRASRESDRLAGYREAATSDAEATPSWRYFPSTGRYVTYNKTALWLHTLERWIGWRRVQRGLSLFFTKSAFTHPSPAEFFAAMNEWAGRDLSSYFDQVYRSSSSFDYAISQLTSEPDDDGTYHTEVVARRLGDGVFPVEVLVRFADGSEARERWDTRDRWTLFKYDRPTRAVSAEIDPSHVLVLDVNRTNNSRAIAPLTAKATRQWSGRWMVWLQDLVLTYAFFV